MEQIRFLIVGAGMSGLAFANAIDSDEVLVVERDNDIGGYCKTVCRDGFTWDYSGHFFHFRNPEIEKWLTDRMPAGEVRTVQKVAKILYASRLIDFPFQKNIHQLPKAEFIECLVDLTFRPDGEPTSFGDMLDKKFGASIAAKFLVPYNRKLYACDLDELDVDAMGRFFPYASLEEIIANFREQDNASYNATFTYPSGGAIRYVEAMASGLASTQIEAGQQLVAVDRASRIARFANGRQIRFEHLVSSAPFDQFVEICGLEKPSGLTSNKVAVFNLGFDRKGLEGVHWLYVPDPQRVFYRVGFYDNIMDTDRMSLYVEVGMNTSATVDLDALRQRVLADLAGAGIVDGHNLVAHHQVVLDPAYVHITAASVRLVADLKRSLADDGIHSIGRYGSWTYCSIEDNIIEARELAGALGRSE